jgi:hypothetical protein
MEALLAGRLSVDDLTEEELLTGILNDKNGERSGRPSNLVPREMHQAVVRRVTEIADGKFRSAVLEAVDNIIAIGTADPEMEPFGVRMDPQVFKAAQYIVERVMGKIPDQVQMTAEVKPWQASLGKVVTVIEGEANDRDGAGQ